MAYISGFSFNDLNSTRNVIDADASKDQTNKTSNSVINSQQQKNIVSFNEEEANIVLSEVINENGMITYRYKLNMFVDYIMATKVNAFKMRVHITKNGGSFGLGNALLSNKVTSDDSNQIRNTDDIISSILSKQASRLDFIRSERKQNISTSYIFDLSSKLDKDSLNAIRYATGVVEYLNTYSSTIIQAKKELQNVLANNLRKNNIGVVDNSINVFNSTNEDMDSMRLQYKDLVDRFKEQYNSLAYDLLVDPANLIGKSTNNMIGTYNALAGQTNKNLPRIDELMKIPGLSSLQSNILNLSNVALANDSVISDNDFVTIPVVKQYTKQFVTDYIDIQIPYIGKQDFTMMFEVLDVQGKVVQLFPYNVRHSFFSNIGSIPVIPPNVINFPKGAIGKNYLDIKQMDPNGAYVRIYKKELSKIANNGDLSYTLIGTVKTSFGDDFVRFYDPTSGGSNAVLYRVTSVNSDLIESTRFSSAVIQNPKSIIAKKSGASNKKRTANIYSTFGRDSTKQLTIYVKDLPPGVIAIDLSKKELSNPQKDIVYVERNRLVPNTNTSAEIAFIDTDVVSGRVYEYRVGMLYRDGIYKTAKTNHIVEYKEVTKNIVNTVLGMPVIKTIDNGKYDIEFTIQKNVLESDTDLIKRYLEDQGFSGVYADQILADRTNLRQLFGTEIYRINKTTSEVEYYGFIQTDLFSDIRYGGPAGVKSVTAGMVYEYVVITYGRNMDTLFSSLQLTETDQRTQKTFTYNPAKFKNPVTLRDGNIVSDNSLLRNHAQSTFALGDIVDIDRVTVLVNEDKPAITSATCVKSTDKQIAIEWEVKGDSKKIDSYILSIMVNKTKSIIGSAHSLPSSTMLTYVYNFDANIKGNVKFMIMPIFFDGTKGIEYSTNNILV